MSRALTATGKRTPVFNVVMPMKLRRLVRKYRNKHNMLNDSEVVRLAVERLMATEPDLQAEDDDSEELAAS